MSDPTQVEVKEPSTSAGMSEKQIALLVVLGAALLFPAAGLAAAVGRFLAGRAWFNAWVGVVVGVVTALGLTLLTGVIEVGTVLSQLVSVLDVQGTANKVLTWLTAAGPWGVVLGFTAGCAWGAWREGEGNPLTVMLRSRREKDIATRTIRDGSAVTVGLSNDDGKSRVVLSSASTNRGTLVLGAPGGGKTWGTTAMLADAAASGNPIVYVDLKGSSDVPFLMAGLAAKHNRPFWHFKVFDAANLPYVGPSPDGPATYNPAGAGGATRSKNLLAGVLGTEVGYFKNTQNDFMLTAFSVLYETGVMAQKAAFAAVAEITDVEALYRLARTIPEDSPRRSGLLKQVESLRREAADKREFNSTIGSARSYINTLMNSAVGPFISNEGHVIDFDEVDRSGGVVVFSLSDTDYQEEARQLGTLIIQDLTTYAGAREQDPDLKGSPFFLVIDEFSALKGDHILGLSARGRSAGMHLLLATQNVADFRRVGEGFKEQMFGNMSSYLFFAGNSRDDCEYFSSFTGKEGSANYVSWEEFQGLKTGECVLINLRVREEERTKTGWLQAPVARVKVVPRDVPAVDEHVVVLNVTTSESGNWVTEKAVGPDDWTDISDLPDEAAELYEGMTAEEPPAPVLVDAPVRKRRAAKISPTRTPPAGEERFEGIDFGAPVSVKKPAVKKQAPVQPGQENSTELPEPAVPGVPVDPPALPAHELPTIQLRGKARTGLGEAPPPSRRRGRNPA